MCRSASAGLIIKLANVKTVSRKLASKLARVKLVNVKLHCKIYSYSYYFRWYFIVFYLILQVQYCSTSNWFLLCSIKILCDVFLFVFLETQSLVWICIHAYVWRWLSSLLCMLFGSRVSKYVTEQFVCQASVFERSEIPRFLIKFNIAL